MLSHEKNDAGACVQAFSNAILSTLAFSVPVSAKHGVPRSAVAISNIEGEIAARDSKTVIVNEPFEPERIENDAGSRGRLSDDDSNRVFFDNLHG